MAWLNLFISNVSTRTLYAAELYKLYFQAGYLQSTRMIGHFDTITSTVLGIFPALPLDWDNLFTYHVIYIFDDNNFWLQFFKVLVNVFHFFRQWYSIKRWMLLYPYQAYFIFYFNVSNKLYILVQYDPVWISLNKSVWFKRLIYQYYAIRSLFSLTSNWLYGFCSQKNLCLLMKSESHTLCDKCLPYLFFVLCNYRIISFDYISSVPYLLHFNELIESYPLKICHLYFLFCVLMKWQRYILFVCSPNVNFEFYLNYRFIIFNDLPSVPYFLCFDEITGLYPLMTFHPYFYSCVLIIL